MASTTRSMQISRIVAYGMETTKPGLISLKERLVESLIA